MLSDRYFLSEDRALDFARDKSTATMPAVVYRGELSGRDYFLVTNYGYDVLAGEIVYAVYVAGQGARLMKP